MMAPRRGPDGRFLPKTVTIDGDPGWEQESAGQLQPKEASPAEQEVEDTIRRGVEYFSFAKSYEDAQRRSETEELEFEGVDMWKPEHRASRAAHVDETSGRQIPARPTISANLLDQAIQQVVNEARQARLAITVKPKTGFVNTKTSGYMKGLLRTIQVDSGALAVRLWALERAAKVGRGGYLIDADFANDGDFDLDLVIRRILDYSTVYWDPYSTAADRSDAEWAIITDWMSEKERRRRWKDKPIIPSEGAFSSEADDWFALDSDHRNLKRVRIATVYEVVHQYRTRAYHPSIGTQWLDEMPAEFQAAVKANMTGVRTREVDTRHVQITVQDGTQILEQRPWRGRYIPIVEVLGKEYFVKGKRRFKGMIANAVELSRAINVIISSATEIAGQMPRTPYMIAAGQDAGWEEIWDDLFTKSYTRVPFNQRDENGDQAGPPVRQQQELQIQGLLYLLQVMQQLLHGVIGNVAPEMRAVNPLDRSGKAIEALQRQGAAGTSNYLDNFATVSMPHEGKILVNAAPQYYDTPGRLLRIQGDSEEEETAILIKVPFIHDEDGNPVAVPCQTCQGAKVVPPATPLEVEQPCPACEGQGTATREMAPKEWQGKTVEYVDFGECEFRVIAAVDRSYQAKQEEALAGMTQLAEAAPNLVPAYAATWVRAMGFTGANEVAEAIDAAFPRPGKEFGDEKVPPQFIAKFTQLQQQHQMAMQALEEAKKLIETDGIKAANQKDLEMIRAGVKARVEDLKHQQKILEITAGQGADERLEVLRGQIQQLAQESQQRHEILLQLLKEKGEKEVERHSVELHDAAAAAAADRADLSAESSDARKALLAEAADDRSAQQAREADARAIVTQPPLASE